MTKRVFSKSTNGIEAATGTVGKMTATQKRDCNTGERKRTRNVTVKQSVVQDESAHDTEVESPDVENEDRLQTDAMAWSAKAKASLENGIEKALDILGYTLQDGVPVLKSSQPSAQSAGESNAIVVDAKTAWQGFANTLARYADSERSIRNNLRQDIFDLMYCSLASPRVIHRALCSVGLGHLFSYALLKNWEWEFCGIQNVILHHYVGGSEKWFVKLIQDGVPLDTICQALRSAGVLYFSALMLGKVEPELANPVADSESTLSDDKHEAVGYSTQDAVTPTASELLAKNNAYNEGINDCLIRLENGGMSMDSICQALQEGGGVDYILFAVEKRVHQLVTANGNNECSV